MFFLQLDEAILNTDEDIPAINEQILAMQAKILVFQTRRTQLFDNGDVAPVSCHQFVDDLSKISAKYLLMRLATARDMC